MINRVVLAVLALVLAIIGVGTTFVPAAFYDSFGIEVTGLPALASELRGTGASLLLIALAIGVGALWTRWAFPAAVVGGLVYLGHAVGRGIAGLVDGAPGESVVVAGVVELVLGVAAVWVAVRTRPRD